MTHSICLKTDFDLSNTAWSYRKNCGNMTIIAESECMGKARKLCTDIEIALEHGAFPAAHALMIDKINEANDRKQPLACRVEFVL